MAACAGLCTTAATGLCLMPGPAAGRLPGLSGPRRASGRGTAPVGLETAMATVIARLKGGAPLVGAFEELGATRFASPRLTEARIARVLAGARLAGERDGQVRRMARHAAQACALSESLGCEASLTLEAVLASYRRERLAEERRRQAMAAPEATIRLLTALPAVTVALGEMLGASPVAFLFGSARGVACLALGAAWYGIGLVWVRRLLRTLRRREASC
ncbi:pilus assembly protein [Bifidobacterium pullorum subsp. saeculare]|uniref:Pilus assembly protein n=2 Tax=Bifidobacterium pullorum TaxID=78448 RepID=A0A938WX52_9BIFI|nr:pilus assembly protein [Bifidobacterium pullorum subsp. saeculare]